MTFSWEIETTNIESYCLTEPINYHYFILNLYFQTSFGYLFWNYSLCLLGIINFLCRTKYPSYYALLNCLREHKFLTSVFIMGSFYFLSNYSWYFPEYSSLGWHLCLLRTCRTSIQVLFQWVYLYMWFDIFFLLCSISFLCSSYLIFLLLHDLWSFFPI